MSTTARPSLREMLLVSHREPLLTLHRLGDSGWTTIEARRQEVIVLTSAAARLHMDDV